MNDAVHGMIFFEACHALHLGSDKTKANLRTFQSRAFAQCEPMLFDNTLIEFGYFTKRKLDLADTFCMRLSDDLIKERLCGLFFTHETKLYILDSRLILNWNLF